MGLKLIFMGTPEFAVPSLQTLLESKHTILAVITSPDKPAGRGMKLNTSPIKKFAIDHQLPLLQPENLKDPSFIQQLHSFNADLFVVVAFRMLPPSIWQMPPKGTINLHASLLPNYRGAAPINWAIINGERETGLTTFFINHQIDTGKIILTEKVTIGDNETAGELHDRLKIIGAKLLLRTIDAIENNAIIPVEQESLFHEPLKTAPKIFKEHCLIYWDKEPLEIHNLIRGLSPFPGAYSYLVNNDHKILTKIFITTPKYESHSLPHGNIISDGKSYISVAVKNGFIQIHQIQLEGKRKLNVEEFLKGFKNINHYCFKS